MRFLTRILLTLLLQYPAFAYASESAVIFMYHRFGESSHPSTNIRTEQFEAHLNYLASNGFRVLPLELVVDRLRRKKQLPDKTAVITIDDAYRSIYDIAYPRLRSRKWPFTVFVSTNVVDQKLAAFLSWDQIREMQNHGASFANHSSSHDYLIRRQEGESDAAWLTRISADINGAQKRLETELGIRTKLFAYPYGEYNAAFRQLILDLGYVALGQHSGPAGFFSDPGALPRFPINEIYGEATGFATKANSLALPVISATPADPVITETNPPRLTIELKADSIPAAPLNCFAGGKPMTISRQTNKSSVFTISAPEPLPKGRSRYNCTAASIIAGRYFWYSHLWINPR